MLGRSESGMSLVSVMALVLVVGFFAYLGLELIPVYFNNWEISEGLNSVATRADAGAMSNEALRSAVQTQFSIGYVSGAHVNRDLRIDGTVGSHRVMVYDYTRRVPFVGNVTLLVHFNDRASVGGS